VTDPDSRTVKTPRGYVQGYNAQAVVTEAQIVIAAEVTIESPDFGHLEPMVAATEQQLRAIGCTETPQVVVADAGYWHQVQIDRHVSRPLRQRTRLGSGEARLHPQVSVHTIRGRPELPSRPDVHPDADGYRGRQRVDAIDRRERVPRSLTAGRTSAEPVTPDETVSSGN